MIYFRYDSGSVNVFHRSLIFYISRLQFIFFGSSILSFVLSFCPIIGEERDFVCTHRIKKISDTYLFCCLFLEWIFIPKYHIRS